ncbi:unnamed protein product [Caenorhabditis auriculariae]|uniref:Uncharacterized protein n=1 Tax=Caenorhabditis auriculariae TaxID=2777116 RepID=A0A8S1H544_9PELO|nr:unnamed protein product [Caenorhabditis auriculariae]
MTRLEVADDTNGRKPEERELVMLLVLTGIYTGGKGVTCLWLAVLMTPPFAVLATGILALGRCIKLNADDFSASQQSDFEREIQVLERDIRQQKESSFNAKTAITLDQLKKISTIGKFLGPQKESFFDRICRAADIQRASLKSRLKHNKDRFEPQNCLSGPSLQLSCTSLFDSQASLNDSQTYLVTPNLQNIIMMTSAKEQRDAVPAIVPEEEVRIPAERQFDLLELGFTYDELRQLIDNFERFKRSYKDLVKPSPINAQQLLNQFSNHLSLNPTPDLRVIGIAFNLLELGNPKKDVHRTLLKQRRVQALEAEEENRKRRCFTPPGADRYNDRDSTISPLDREIERDELVIGMQND